MRIGVHRNTLDERDAEESIETLKFYGYDIVNISDLFGSAVCDYIIDKRSPSWRGWRDILSNFDWRHYDKVVERNRQKELDRTPVCVIQSEDETECFT